MTCQGFGIQRVAAERGIPLAPEYDTFNGPNHDEDPLDQGYVMTANAKGLFLGDVNETGRAVMADLLRDRGYEPMVP